MSSYVFDKYRKEKCEFCLRNVKCSRTEQDIILCSSASFYKGSQDAHLLTDEEIEELDGKFLKEL